MRPQEVPISRFYGAYMDSWEQFLDAHGELPPERSSDSYWWLFEVGRPGVHVGVVIMAPTRKAIEFVGIRVELCFVKKKLGDDARRLYEAVLARKDDWESSIGTQLDWNSHAPQNQYQVAVNMACDPFDREAWLEQHQETLRWMRRFRAHFDTRH